MIHIYDVWLQYECVFKNQRIYLIVREVNNSKKYTIQNNNYGLPRVFMMVDYCTAILL